MIRVTLPRILMIAAFAVLAFSPMFASAAPDSVHFNNKFEFPGVTVTNADGTTTTVTIRAASKQTDEDNRFTVCGYFNASDEFLGQFESADFASANPTEVEAFCVAHFVDRTV